MSEWKSCGSWKCRYCGQSEVEYYVWESSDGAYEDYKYHCNACDKSWWVEGSDY